MAQLWAVLSTVSYSTALAVNCRARRMLCPLIDRDGLPFEIGDCPNEMFGSSIGGIPTSGRYLKGMEFVPSDLHAS